MSSEPASKDDRLSSWKEIAAYLDSKPRTCIRWEKTLGLPVHRLEGASKSRVYAFKLELDAWLRTKLKNGSTPGSPATANRSLRIPRWLFLAVPALFVIAAAAIFLLPLKPKNPEVTLPPSTDGIPRSTGVFDMMPGDIITTEFLPEGKLRVWRRKNAISFFESWRMAPLRHASLAIGDLDGDADLEVVAPGYCREFYEEDGRTSSKIRFFLNAYKRGVANWWQTTFYDHTQCVYEPEDFEFTDIAVGNLDAIPGNEIVLGTAHGLSVFRYDRAEGALKLLDFRASFLDREVLHLRAVRLADLDGDGVREVLILGNEWDRGVEVENRGWLVVLKWQEGRLATFKAVALDANVSAQSLRTGDVVPGGGREAVFPLYRRKGRVWHVSVAGWNLAQGFVLETPIGRNEEEVYRPIHLDVGDIKVDQPGDDVVVARSEPNELLCCSWNGASLVLGAKYRLTPGAELTNVFVNPAATDGKRLARIIAIGSVKPSGQPGSFYLEAVDYAEGYVPVWLKTGGDDTDIKVSYAAFGQ
jgi:hypothetical protein